LEAACDAQASQIEALKRNAQTVRLSLTLWLTRLFTHSLG